MAARHEKDERTIAPEDPQETKALNAVEKALRDFLPTCPTPRSLGAVAISAWIISRSKQAAGLRLNENVVWDFERSKLKGFIEAALGDIGENLADIPVDVPLFELSKDQIVEVFVAVCTHTSRAAMAIAEQSCFPFDDEVPF